MSAWADDQRYYYGEDIGRSEIISATAATSVKTAASLEPGRYELRITDFNGATAVWVSQGRWADVVAAAAPPSTKFRGHTAIELLNLPVMKFMVRAGDRDGIAVFAVGATAEVQITKVSRDRQ